MDQPANHGTGRRWYQFSLKAILLLMLLSAAYVGGRVAERSRSREIELRARDEARRAILAEQEARRMAEQMIRKLQDAQEGDEAIR